MKRPAEAGAAEAQREALRPSERWAEAGKAVVAVAADNFRETVSSRHALGRSRHFA